MNAKYYSLTLIIIGSLLFSTPYIPLAAIVIDTTEPEVRGHFPVEATDYDVKKGIGTLSISLFDETGVESVVADLSWTDVDMNLHQAGRTTGGSETWIHDIPPEESLFLTGSHWVLFTVKDGVYTITHNVSFTMSKVILSGNWYINDKEVIGPRQIITLMTTDLDFKFVRNATNTTLDDADVIVKIVWIKEGDVSISGEQTLDLTDTTNHVWTTYHAFPDGKYTMSLIADARSVNAGMLVYSIMGDFGLSAVSFGLEPIQFIGIAMMIAGAVVWKREESA